MSGVWEFANRPGLEWLVDIPHSFIHEEINREVFLAWVDEFRIVDISRTMPLWPKLYSGKYQRISELSDYQTIPYSRDSEMYVDINKERILVVHFYEDVDESIITQEVEAFASERGLDVLWLAYDESWYNPGVSLTGIFTIGDTEKYLDYIEIHRKYDPKENKHWI